MTREIRILREIELSKVWVMLRHGVRGLRYRIPAHLIEPLLDLLEQVAERNNFRIAITLKRPSEARVLLFAGGGGLAGMLIGGALAGLPGALIGASAGAGAGALIAHARLEIADGGAGSALLVLG